MKRITLAFAFLTLALAPCCRAQFWYGDHWYDNPLGFAPVELHTRNAFLIPALAVGVCLLLTPRDSAHTGRMVLFNEAGPSWGYKYPYTSMFQNNVGVQWYLRQWMSVGFDIGLYLPRDQFNNTAGIVLRPFARFLPVNNERWRLYFESGGGFVYFANQFPLPTDQDARLGTNLNGATRYGLGAEINLDHHTAVMLGARHVHVSNGNTLGAERNPSHDSNGFFLGVSYAPGAGMDR